jgi:hypothetical protein
VVQPKDRFVSLNLFYCPLLTNRCIAFGAARLFYFSALASKLASLQNKNASSTALKTI